MTFGSFFHHVGRDIGHFVQHAADNFQNAVGEQERCQTLVQKRTCDINDTHCMKNNGCENYKDQCWKIYHGYVQEYKNGQINEDKLRQYTINAHCEPILGTLHHVHEGHESFFKRLDPF